MSCAISELPSPCFELLNVDSSWISERIARGTSSRHATAIWRKRDDVELTIQGAMKYPHHPLSFSIIRTLLVSSSLAWLSLASAAHAGVELQGAATSAEPRYGLFDLLDHRSTYGSGAFPEPFLNDDSDLEVNEARLDWLHTGGAHEQGDLITAEIEKGFGPLTLEIEVPFERDWSEGHASEGMANIDLGARVPFFQSVSPDGGFDTTFGVAVELGIPTHSSVSRDTEFVPKLFNDTKIGNFTLQTIVGYSTLWGVGDDGGLQTLEYGFTAGYAFQKPLTGVQQFIPIFELIGEKEINHDQANSILGNAGFRVNLRAWGRIQPRLGAGYVFPMNAAAHEDVHGGVIVSLVFEY
jgi:hypothetical protein